ncbi:MAG: Glycosyl transferase family 2 [candidate division WS6 bacterium GW2011_GWF2_39_15]|uniref:Glycosyl transferase family 2 n=1 Tax=candidate division WS6 bacterium GW2011_GWF2_39_15 TaxID=1619100 RepID=A0A0G0MYB2_9BACT|nr:MAG: Glycosyl transferase family 2 [candidate division WS6 bacterium GW2011_GWF2_39_15]
MLSVIITSYKEPGTIGKVIESIAKSSYSGIPKDFELIQISPDKETLHAGLKATKSLRLGKKFRQLIDPHRGKPYALNFAFKEAKGDILILTDGEVFFQKNSVKHLLKPYENEKIGGVSGMPVSSNKRNSFYGYMSHLLVDSAHHRRTRVLDKVKDYYISGKGFFPMSGYILSIKKGLIKKLQQDLLTEDAYMSYEIRRKGFEIAYAPKAKVTVKYPTTFKDYYTQKLRSIGGFIQLKQLGIFEKDKQSRSFWIELPYAFFVLIYPKNIKELFWSLLMFPVRLVTWIGIFIERIILRKGVPKTGWKRIESTK